jgi:hypothetical protein
LNHLPLFIIRRREWKTQRSAEMRGINRPSW